MHMNSYNKRGRNFQFYLWIPAKSLLVPGYATDGSNVVPGWQVPKGEHALAGGAVHS